MFLAGCGKVENRVYHFAHSSTAATNETLPLLSKINFGCFQTALFLTSPKINSAKTRWGSMSGKKSVNFSWRLILADDDIIDVVVVHELAHIKQMNHSDKFWAEVEKILPDWQEREKRLKELSCMINAQNWEVE